MNEFVAYIMKCIPDITFELTLIPRFVLAAVCGALIGIERKNRAKEAGIRTHLIVAIAAAVMMIISKYGFFDLLRSTEFGDAVKLDPSRVANGIVSSIGFLGAGMIFVRKQVVNGLTTAAGLWATVGIGMAFGAGMFVLGFAATFGIIICQIILHKNFRVFRTPITEEIIITVENKEGVIDKVRELLAVQKMEVIDLSATKERDEITVCAFVRMPKGFVALDTLKFIQECEYIKSVKF